MDIEVVREAAVVKEVSGDVVAVKPDGSARKVALGDTVVSGELVIVADKSSILVETPDATVNLDANTVATDDAVHGWGVSPVAGEVEFDLAQLGEGAIGEDELAAIQDAILAGADPTELLEATAAGAGAAGSANGGFVTIEYNGAEVLASTFFETSGFETTSVEQADEDIPPIVFADGGQDISLSLVENVLGDSEKTQTSVTVFAASLALDPETFVPEPLSLASLLSELNSDITSNGNPVVFTYNAAENEIEGKDPLKAPGEDVVLTIKIDATNIGNDVSITLTTTINHPIDHTPSVGGGQVAFSGDQITVSFDITGADTGGNPIQAPISAQVGIGDGANPSISEIQQANLYEAGLSGGSQVGGTDTTVTRTIEIATGSDEVTALRLDVDEFNGRADAQGLFSAGQRVVIEQTSDGVYRGYITVSDSGGDRQVDVLSITLDQNNFDQYSVTLLKELDHSAQGQDTLQVNLPIYVVDADSDESARTNLVVNVGDDIQVVKDGSLSVDEPNVTGDETSNVVNVITSAGAEQGTVKSVTFDGTTIDYTPSQTNYALDNGTLVVTADGEVSFIPKRNLTHPEDNRIEHTILVTVADNDGDELTSTVDLVIKDGQDPVITAVTESQIYEAGLKGGNEGTGVGPTDITDSGTIAFNNGSDDVVAFKIDVDEFNSRVKDQLFSGTKRVLVEELEDGSYRGYITADDSVTKIAVFTVSFDSNNLGKYNVALLKELDHSAQGQDNLKINLPVYAVDSDNDPSNEMALVINVGDDIQVVTDGSLSVVEPNVTGDATSNVVDVITQAGADQATVKSVTFDGVTINYTEGQTDYPLDHGTLVVNADGKVSFVPKRNLTHPEDNRIEHTIVVTVADKDGDELTSTVDLVIKDGKDPVINGDSKSTVNEDDIASDDAIASGKFITEQGSDSVVKYELVNVSNSESGLKSGGDDVSISKTAGASGSTIYTGKADGAVIFTLELKADGSYIYTQEKALDHAEGANSLTIPFDVVAIDGDGDVSPSARLAIEVKDDKPILNGVTGESEVDEDDLSGIGSDQTQDTEIKGNFTIAEGADGVVEYQLVDVDDAISQLKSGGERLEWADVSISGTTSTYTAKTTKSGEPVFTLKFNTADNSYTFELLKPLDHADGNLENSLEMI
ncbi:retention module-containing protein, partial [Vibrio sp. M260118]|uniref:retention module-containing protein n=1 Tax=Vibrio sp. M260118 TaxID=3020896 RepID=UPI002F3F251D